MATTPEVAKKAGSIAGNAAGNMAKSMFINNFRITLGLISMVMFANPSGFSYYHWTIANKFITVDKLVSLAPMPWVMVIIGAVMLFFSTRLLVKAWSVLRSFFDRLWAFVLVALVTVLQFVFFKEAIMQNMMNLSYVIFVDITVFCLYAIFTKRADFKDFKTRGVNVLQDHDEEEHDHDEDDDSQH